QALKKEFFAINLGGLFDTSILLGASENSLGTEIGQLAKGLAETKKYDPLILLDEIDKAGSASKTAIHDCLLKILDPEQNHAVLDYYLDVKLDLSHVFFMATANDLTKIPPPLRDRMLIIEALEALINKTNEKAREVNQGVPESKIIITPDLVNQIIPQSFSNYDNYDLNSPKEQKEKEQFYLLHEELKTLRRENNKLTNQLANHSQNKLKASKFHALAVIKKALGNAKLERNKIILDNRNYEKEINEANSTEEVEALREEFLLGIMENFPLQKATEKPKSNYSSSWSTQPKDHKILKKLVQEISKMNDNNTKIKILEEQLIQIQEQNRHLESQLNNFQQSALSAKD
ncbi:17329_t:CDS:2, partial [Funneliformis geosporum]